MLGTLMLHMITREINGSTLQENNNILTTKSPQYQAKTVSMFEFIDGQNPSINCSPVNLLTVKTVKK
jgi:hypothetical protein